MTPALYPQYAALRGDPSDNLPGVPGVGEKTAAKLINTYGGLDGIFANVDDADAEAAGVARRARGAGPQEPRDDGASARRAARRVDLGDAGDRAQARRGQAAVRLPRVPHVRRPSGRGARRPPGRVGRSAPSARSCVAEVTVVESAADAVELIGSLAVLDVCRRGSASRAAARSPVSRSSPTPTVAEVAWIPAELLADDCGRGDRRGPRQRPRPQRQGAHALAARPRPST